MSLYYNRLNENEDSILDEVPDDNPIVQADIPIEAMYNLNVNVTPRKEKPNCCFAKLFYDKCAKTDKCTYDHSPEGLLKGFFYYAECLKNCKTKPSEYPIGYSEGKSAVQKILHRSKPTYVKKLSNLSENNTSFEDDATFDLNKSGY